MWFSLARLALKTGGHIYQNRQKTKAAMSDAALLHAERMARGEESYQGKLLEARQNDFIILAHCRYGSRHSGLPSLPVFLVSKEHRYSGMVGLKRNRLVFTN